MSGFRYVLLLGEPGGTLVRRHRSRRALRKGDAVTGAPGDEAWVVSHIVDGQARAGGDAIVYCSKLEPDDSAGAYPEAS